MNSIAICVVTYNHEKYISQTIESVLKQNISIPIKIYIGEDCSTDKTREICLSFKQQYPDKIELVLSDTNLGLVRNTIQLLKIIQERGNDYVAMLDGDDYWIDEFKLQKQFDFLEQHKDCGLIHTNNDLLWDDIRIERHLKPNPLKGYVFDCIENFNVANCTVMFRTSLLQYIDFSEFVAQGFMSCDYVMYTVFSKYMNFGFIEDFTAVWRRGHSSVSNTNSKEKDIAYIDNDLRMWNYLGQKFPKRFGHSEKESEAWRNFRIFNIAFRYKDYELAKGIIKRKNMAGRNNYTFRLKKIAATNRCAFYIWCAIKKG